MQVEWLTMDALGEVSEEEKKNFVHQSVVDEKDHKIGSLHSLHKKEENRNTDFVVISSGWPLSHLFLVPVSAVEVTPDRKRLRLPFSREFIEAAPALRNAKIISFADTVLARSYFLGEVPEFHPGDVIVNSLNRPRESPGYDPNDTGLTK